MAWIWSRAARGALLGAGVLGMVFLGFGATVCSGVTYAGSWTNTTFGSTGSVKIDVVTVGPDVTVTADMGGFVFGIGDPPPVTVFGTIAGGAQTFSLVGDPTFGDVSAAIDVLGNLTAMLTNVPHPGISQVTATGTADANTIHVDYTVTFTPAYGGGTAVGTMDAAVPEPATVVLLSLGAAALAIRRRGGHRAE